MARWHRWTGSVAALGAQAGGPGCVVCVFYWVRHGGRPPATEPVAVAWLVTAGGLPGPPGLVRSLAAAMMARGRPATEAACRRCKFTSSDIMCWRGGGGLRGWLTRRTRNERMSQPTGTGNGRLPPAARFGFLHPNAIHFAKRIGHRDLRGSPQA